MAEDEEKESEDVWKSIIEEVKKKGKPVKEASIDVSEKQVIPKQDIKKPEAIEKISIEKSIEIPKESIEKPLEDELEEEKPKEMVSKQSIAEEPSKFTTIMITKELKERLVKAKNPKESYGKLIERLLEK